MNQPILRAHPPRRVVSIFSGNVMQICGIILSCALLWICVQPIHQNLRIPAMIAGYLFLYFNTHSIMHFLVGTIVGIRFRHYSIGGSAHAPSLPVVLRKVFASIPFYKAHTQPDSMRAAAPTAKAFMYAAGIMGTVVFCTGSAIWAYHFNAPGGLVLLIFNVIWLVSSIIVEAKPSGDLGKAYRALKK